MPVKRIQLLGGAYVTKGLIADAQRCVNMFPEKNPQDAEAPVTHYPTPGLTLIVPGPIVAPVRGLYFANNSQLYAVIGKNVYYIDVNYTVTLLGTVADTGSMVSFIDNGATLVIVIGTTTGYMITLATNAFAVITDPNFFGGDKIDYIDTFLVSNITGTQSFISSLSNTVSWDALYIANKTASADLLVTLVVVHREIWLLGKFTTEVWYDAGNAGFPFALVPGVMIQHGCAALYSVQADSQACYWLSQDKNGKALVMKGQAYQAAPISTPAIVQEFSTYSTISDAIAYMYQQDGHVFYVLNFPTANKTWAYDLTTDAWHQRTWQDLSGEENRHRAQCHAYAYGKNIVGDWENGNIYILDQTVYTDNGVTIQRRRGMPHLSSNGKRIHHAQFIADIETGEYQPLHEGDPAPQLSLRWSDDRGKSWGNPVMMPLGALGQFLTQPSWRRLGIARDRVYEIFWDVPGPCALNGAWVDVTELGT